MSDENIELTWMPVYWEKLLAGTTHMDAAELGGYLLLIVEQWKKGSLPNDARKLKKISRISSTDKLNTILEKLVTDADGNLINEACAQIRNDQINKYARQSVRGKKGAETRWQKNAASMQQASCKHAVSTVPAIADIKKEERRNNTVHQQHHLLHQDFSEKIFSAECELDRQNLELGLHPKRALTPLDCAEFNAFLFTDGKAHQTFNDYKAHLRNWLNTKPKTNYEQPANTRKKPTGPNTTHVVNAADAILQQYTLQQHTTGPAEPH